MVFLHSSTGVNSFNRLFPKSILPSHRHTLWYDTLPSFIQCKNKNKNLNFIQRHFADDYMHYARFFRRLLSSKTSPFLLKNYYPPRKARRKFVTYTHRRMKVSWHEGFLKGKKSMAHPYLFPSSLLPFVSRNFHPSAIGVYVYYCPFIGSF